MNFSLSQIKSKEDLKRLFIEQWNWNSPSISGEFFDTTEEFKDFVVENDILAEKINARILYFGLTNLTNPEKQMKSLEREIITSPKIKDSIANSVFVFSGNNFDYCDFAKAEKVGAAIKIKRFSINPENRNKLRTTQEQLAKLKMEAVKLSPSYVKNQIEAAFSVEEITEKFYDDYIAVFQKIKKDLQKQKVDVENDKQEEKLRDFIHQILNRLMFLYFVQKRGCFAGDKDFLADFWDKYKENHRGENNFHLVWLEVLFFEALNQSSFQYSGKKELGDFNSILKQAPYLNGGLFEKSDLDEIGWQIADDFFEDIFNFLQGYNFTIEESTPLDIDIAINPEMLGNIYEHLVNTEEAQEQAKAGIFYTPKTEIDLMIKRALVEFLFGKTNISKEKLFRFVFNPEEVAALDKNEAKVVLNVLNEILILDPACGSGHYLVVCSQTLYSLEVAIREFLGEKFVGKYQTKKEIIEKNLYGNDIKPWAANVARLRLWLDLFVDAQDDFLQNQTEPLLPNLGFKIRNGDSLLQELAGEIIPLRRIRGFFKAKRGLLADLVKRKQFVYKRGTVDDYKTTLNSEKNLLQQVLSAKKIELEKQLQHFNIQSKRETANLFGEKQAEQISLFEKDIRETKTAIASIDKFKEAVAKLKEPPMLWDLAFAEVFQMKNGFDIVIANPPYVRQEQICDLNNVYQKSEYKSKLIEQIKTDWSYNYDGNYQVGRINRFDKKSDLYVYFYLKSLKLLNPQGVLCFITSNSWLDVGYGGFLQEILLKNCPILAIYDNQAKRSFKHADVNTIISLLKAPSDKQWSKEIQANEPKFAMFKKSFEEISNSEIFIELESQSGFKKYPEGERKENEIFRLHKANQKQLLEYGLDKAGKEYKGNKWGGKYLRAPEIYWTILEKGKDKLVRLADIAEVRFGIKTGANEFFYVQDITDKIEE